MEYWEATSCKEGHGSSAKLETSEGGGICLLCFCNLVSNPNSLTLHISYALTLLSKSLRQPQFLQNLLQFHAHLLAAPLSQALLSCSDEHLAEQMIDLIAYLCGSDEGISGDFVSRIADRLSSERLSWNNRHIYTLHCFGILLNHQSDCPSAIKEQGVLISNLVSGLQLPSEELRGEILFVLYKLSILQDPGDDGFFSFCPRLLYLALEALMKTQNDDVRMNCLALLTVLARQGCFENSFASDQSGGSTEADNFMQTPESDTSLIILFAEAIKAPLLSSDAQVQISALDLIFHSLSSEVDLVEKIEVLVEESVADYVFEGLRLSKNKDPLVISCILVLSLLATAEHAFRQRLAIGFPTLVRVLHYAAGIPLHPVLHHTLKLVYDCISSCPGIVSKSQLEDLFQVLTGLFGMLGPGETVTSSDTFTMACQTLVALLKTPSSRGVPGLADLVKKASKDALLASLSGTHVTNKDLLLYSLYLLKESYAYCHEENCGMDSETRELANGLTEICEAHIIPCIKMIFDEAEEEVILGILETFHSILLQGSDIQTQKFAESLASSSLFGFFFECLGVFPSAQMKGRVYLMFSSIVDRVLGHHLGQPIRDACLNLPSDPCDLLFLLGQKSSSDPELIACQSAVLLILYTSSLYNQRLADENQVLASLEQSILVNSSNFTCGLANSDTLTQLVHLYGLIRGANMNNQAPYSIEAEKQLLNLIAKEELDLLTKRIHKTAFRWLFEQEEIRPLLLKQFLNFCRLTSSEETLPDLDNNSQMIDAEVLAELVAGGDNSGAALLVSLLKQLSGDGHEDDIASVVNLMTIFLNLFPPTSNQFCFNGICIAISALYHRFAKSSPRVRTSCSLLVFNILRSVDPKILLDHEEAWLSITLKQVDILIPILAADPCNVEGHLLISILVLILHHSTNQGITEASKAIILDNSLVSAINSIVQAVCTSGPVIVELDEETGNGETVVLLLLLHLFSLRSLPGILQLDLDWQDFLEASTESRGLSFMVLRCNYLCRLIYFGSSMIKLVASQCLLEILTRIGDQRNDKHELRCSVGYLQSMVVVLEGLIFYSDIRVSMNCGLCLSVILGWEKFGSPENRAIRDDKWYRVVMEELALSLAAPGLASKSFTNQHKPAAHVAIALLRLNQVPGWMRSVFDSACISGIIDNLSASNVSAEMVQLFQELVACEFVEEDQVRGLHRVFQDIYSTMPRVRDIAWEHMTSVAGSTSRVRCNYCHRKMSGGATRMKEHLLGQKGEVAACTRIPRAIQDHIRREVDKSKAKAKAKGRRDEQFLEDELDSSYQRTFGEQRPHHVPASHDSDSDPEMATALRASRMAAQQDEDRRRASAGGRTQWTQFETFLYHQGGWSCSIT